MKLKGGCLEQNVERESGRVRVLLHIWREYKLGCEKTERKMEGRN